MWADLAGQEARRSVRREEERLAEGTRTAVAAVERRIGAQEVDGSHLVVKGDIADARSLEVGAARTEVDDDRPMEDNCLEAGHQAAGSSHPAEEEGIAGVRSPGAEVAGHTTVDSRPGEGKAAGRSPDGAEVLRPH